MPASTNDPVVTHDNTDGTPASPANEPLQTAHISVGDGSANLDALLTAKGGNTANPDGPLKTPDEAAVQKEADETKRVADAAKLVEDKAAADKKAEEDAKAAEAGKKGVDKPAGKVDPVTPPAEPEDEFSKIKLPANAKGAVTESFASLKAAARAETQRLAAEVEELKSKIPAEGAAITPELQKELDELRAFQAVHNYQQNPEFINTYVAPVEANNNAILAKLKEAGFSDEHITKIKTIGIAKLDWEPVLAALPSVTKRIIEGKLIDNESLAEKRAAAVAALEKAPAELTAKQTREAEATRTQETAKFLGTIDSVLDKVDWAKAKEIPASATAEQKLEIEKFNTFVKEQNDRKALMIADRSPEMHGTLVASTLLAYQFKRTAELATARAEAAEAELEKVRKSSSTARRNSQAPAAGGLPVKPPGVTQTGKDMFAAFEAANKTRE